MKLLRVFFIAFIVALAGLFLVWKKAPDLIASNLSKKMQVEVKIDDINLSTKDVKVEKIQIGNPTGSKLPVAFSAGSIQVGAPILNYTKDPIVIDSIEIDNIYLSLEMTSPTGMPQNWAKIMENLKKSSPPAKPEDSNKKSTSVLIKKLILTNINADLVLAGKVQKIDQINRIEFTDVSSENGVSFDQIAQLILEQTLRSVLKPENIGNMLQKTLTSPKSVLDTLINPLK